MLSKERKRGDSFENIPEEFMNNDMWRHAIDELFDHFVLLSNRQANINEKYEELYKTLFR